MKHLLLALCALAAAPAADRPPIPAVAGSVKALIPHGWHALGTATGDLNSDRLPDAAVALASDREKTVRPGADLPARLLVVAFQERAGYRRAAVDDEVLLGKFDGGVFGDPFDSVRIEHGTLLVEHYGGSNDRWGYVERFRWQNRAFEQIGHTGTATRTVDPASSSSREINLLTGLVEERRTGAASGPRHCWYREMTVTELRSLPGDLTGPLGRPAVLGQIADLEWGRKSWKGPADLSATLSAAIVGGARDGSLFVRAAVQDNQVTAGDGVELRSARDLPIRAYAVTKRPFSGGYLWEARYRLADVGIRRGTIAGRGERESTGWGAGDAGTGSVSPLLRATLEVQDFDAGAKLHARLSTSRSGRSVPASFRFASGTELPRLGTGPLYPPY